MTLPPIEESIADISEGKLVSRLVGEHHWRDFLLNIKGLPEAPKILQQVALGSAPGAPAGDVDVLLVPPHWPAEATAIEFKRIKFGRAAFLPDGQPNKLHEYRKAVEQANRLQAVGFHQVYLYVLVVVDSRGKNEGRISYEGLSSEQRSIVETTVSLEHLHPHVGLVVCTLVQPMDYPPLTVGGFGGNLKRAATPSGQPRELTEWVLGLVE
jgi:hypothetical protein